MYLLMDETVKEISRIKTRAGSAARHRWPRGWLCGRMQETVELANSGNYSFGLESMKEMPVRQAIGKSIVSTGVSGEKDAAG